MSGTILFVYNADEGVLAAIGDAVHKAVSPGTYACSLCAVSYGAVRMRPEWRAHLRSLPYRTRFFHRQDFRRTYPGLDEPLPAILFEQGGHPPRVIVDTETLNRTGSVEELIAALDGALATVRDAG